MVTRYIELTLRIINTIFHSMGAYLLLCQYKSKRKNVQQIFMINLCINEALMNSLGILCTPAQLIIFLSEKSRNVLSEIQTYIRICGITGVYLSFYLSMIFITVDRLIGVMLSVTYRKRVTIRKVKHLLAVTWSLCGLICATFSFLQRFLQSAVKAYLQIERYVEMTFNFFFIFIGIMTYAFIFKAFRKSLVMRTESTRVAPTANKSFFSIFKGSRFFIPVMIILTYFIFTVLPNLVDIFCGGHLGKEVEIAFRISYRVSDLLDAFIYVFLQESVRSLLSEKLRLHKIGQLFRLANIFSSKETLTSVVVSSTTV